MKKSVTLLFIFISLSSFAQYDGSQINLEVKGSEKSHIRFSLYKKDSLTYCISIKHNPKMDLNNWSTLIEQDYDILYLIDKEIFNEMVEKVIKLPYPKILNGMIFHNSIIKDDDTIVELEYVAGFYDRISYTIQCFYCNTKERNLEQILEVCQDVILLAKMNPQRIL
jgi:hypothetical protein